MNGVVGLDPQRDFFWHRKQRSVDAAVSSPDPETRSSMGCVDGRGPGGRRAWPTKCCCATAFHSSAGSQRQGVRPASVDDVVQETLLTIHRARQTYDPGRSFTAWLRMIAQRRAIDGLRRAGRTGAREIHEPLAYENHADPGDDPEEAAFGMNQAARLVAALAQASGRQRDAIEQIALRGTRSPKRRLRPDARPDRSESTGIAPSRHCVLNLAERADTMIVSDSNGRLVQALAADLARRVGWRRRVCGPGLAGIRRSHRDRACDGM